MIDQALSAIAFELNARFKRQFSLNENMLVLSSLNAESRAKKNENKLLCSLVGLEQEPAVPVQYSKTIVQSGVQTNSRAPIFLNLSLLFSSSFADEHYLEGLKYLGHLILYFNEKPSFDRQNTPDLGQRIEKFNIELMATSFTELSDFWTKLGTGIRPGALYKVRILINPNDRTDHSVVQVTHGAELSHDPNN